MVLCDAVLSKSYLLTCNANTFLQSRHSNDVNQPSVECLDVTRKRNRNVSSTDDDSVNTIETVTIAQVALYKAEALLKLGRAHDALLCVDRLVSLY